jgi:hypothetical protein
MQSKITLIESPVKKARGRPRIIPIEELPIPKLTRSTNEPIPVAVAEKKKRGRPRIMPIAVIEEPTPEPPALPVVITEKKRGRPKKLII